MKTEWAMLGGVSFPLGNYAALADAAGEEGNAGVGYFAEIRMIQRSMLKPLWNLQLTAGYMQHPVKAAEVSQAFDLAYINAKPWKAIYMVPTIAFRGGRNLKFECYAGAGISIYQGWNYELAFLGKNQALESRFWSFKPSVAALLRAGLNLGVKLNKRCLIYLDGSYTLGRGYREGQLVSSTYAVDPSNMTAIEPALFRRNDTIYNKVIFNMANIALGLKYQVFKHLYDPNIKYWNYY